ncbi:MAG: flavin reductase family protein [Spirochaetota bacterium]|nr:flavin reductase family protein [Spirochaetota bacterium]
MDKKQIKALGKMTYGIYVLTTCHDEKINGMIASWVSQVSYDPPIVMVALHPRRYSHYLLEKNKKFALHILYQSQKEFMKRFKGPDPEAKFDEIEWTRGRTNCPILKECIAYMECIVRESFSMGNHTLFFGEVIESNIFSDKEPLSTNDYEGVYIGKD